jgi:hypothetical protein
MRCQFGDEEAGERHGTPFVVLWTVPLQSATVDFGDCLFDVELSAR